VDFSEDRIKERKQFDEAEVSAAFNEMAGVVMKKGRPGEKDEDRKNYAAIDAVLHWYHIRPRQIPGQGMKPEELLDYILRPSGMLHRTVQLDRMWYKNASGAMLGWKEDGSMTALIPRPLFGYRIYDPEDGSTRKAEQAAGQITDSAICFYRPLPQKTLQTHDLLRYVFSTLSSGDIILTVLFAVLVTLIGLLPPYATRLLFADITQSGITSLIAPVALFILGSTISAALFGIARNVMLTRTRTRSDVAVNAAVMMRVLSFPTEFFGKYASGDLVYRLESFGRLCTMLTDAVLTSGLSAVLSLVYLGQIFYFAPELVLPAAAVTGVTAVLTVVTVFLTARVNKKCMEYTAQTDGLMFGMISGIQKIRTAGAEKRAFARWAGHYTNQAKLQYDPPFFLKISGVAVSAASLGGTIAIYFLAASAHTQTADYMSFNTSYGMLASSFAALSSVAVAFANIRPVKDMIRPILETVPETNEDLEDVGTLSGKIEVSGVSFRYTEETPLILNELSFRIEPGQYIAIVGRSGCGKSTLLRLLIGFETPQRGAVYYDGKDLKNLDLPSLRRRIGVVTQNGKLLTGDIFSNIAIGTPGLTLQEAWEAAEIAGLADDIRRMPMEMNTFISEGSGGVSGGQRQRILIARAVAAHPSILLFDEATSALDNLTQKHVSEALSQLGCTRVVIAHRLSTVRSCERIIVLDQGRIIEDGTYDELIARKGFFAEMVERQRLEKEG
jgi:NHLM bacteriocin system ABC transporter ATP-binding protein